MTFVIIGFDPICVVLYRSEVTLPESVNLCVAFLFVKFYYTNIVQCTTAVGVVVTEDILKCC